MDHAVTQEKPMTKPLLAVGIDPAKRVHRAIGVLYPDTVVRDVEFPNQIEACRNLDARLVADSAT